ncbi:MAG: purine biosynthesis protein PurH [Aristaeellaceae bacterium]
MKSYFIKDTTREERAQIVAEALGNIEATCDGCMPGLAEMYQAYIDGDMELRDCNAAFNTRYVSGRQGPERGGSCMRGL